MRTFVLILMLALLPLRMWAAEDMAVRMAQDQVAGAMSGAATMPEDCPMMGKAGAISHDQGHPEHQTGDESPSTSHCLTCQLCGAAACPSEVAMEPGPAPSGPLESLASRYLSVQLAPDLRPPIS